MTGTGEDGLDHDTSRAGFDSSSNRVRVSVGASGLPGVTSMSSMVRFAVAVCPWTVHVTFPV